MQDKGKHDKFDTLWIGPFKISEVFSNNTYRLQDLECVEVFNSPINGHFMKKCLLATIFVLGTKVPRSAGCTRSAQTQHGKISFQVTSQASGRSFVVERPRPIYKVDRWSPGSRGYQVTRGIASEKAPIFQDKIWVVRSSDAWRKI
jgi:hypothetical protein